MNLSKILNFDELPKGLENPVDINISGNEEMFHIHPGNISTLSKKGLYDFFNKEIISVGTEFIKIKIDTTLETLNEERYNARIGYALKNEIGNLNIGHANREKLIEAISDKEFINFVTTNSSFLIEENKDNKKVHDLFLKLLISYLHSQDGISHDTVNDLIISIELESIKKYTKNIYEEMIKQGISCSLNKYGSVLYNNLNLIFIPQTWMDKTTFTNNNEIHLTSISLMMLSGMFKTLCFDKIKKDQLSKNLKTRSLNTLTSFDWEECFLEKKTWEESYSKFFEQIKGQKSIDLFEDVEIIKIIKGWFDQNKKVFSF